MAVSVKHWGELEDPQQSQSVQDLLSEDDVTFLIRKSCLTESTKNDTPHGYGVKELLPESSKMDCEVLNIVHLQRHAAALRQLISLARSRNSTSQQTQQRLPNPPPMPQLKHRESRHPRTHPLGFLTPSHTPFTRGESSALPEILSSDATRRVLTKCVCTLAAQAGWDASSEEALGVLRDTADNFMKRLTEMLRVAVDREALQGGCGFPDAVEQVFHTMGLGSIRSLHYFYQRQVLGQQNNLEKICRMLMSEYMQLAARHNKDLPPPSWESVVIKQEIKQELDEAEDVDVPELHFPSTSDGDLTLQPSATLRTGFEMLHSLERQQLLSEDDVDLGALGADEEDDVDNGETVATSSTNHAAKRARRI